MPQLKEKKMSDKQINIAIAEACGWKYVNNETHAPDGSFWWSKELEIPDYCNDLNAMHKIFLTLPTGSHITFGRHLQEVCGEGLVGYVPSYPEDFARLTRIAHATAAQRAEAFLKTINKWEGGSDE